MPTNERRAAGLSKPAALKGGHDVASFDCGTAELNDWLKDRSKRAAENDTARTFVVCRGTKRVVGYFCLSAGSVAHIDEASGDRAPRNLRQNSPDPIPVIILGRLAVDTAEHRRGLGSALLSEGMRRAGQASKIIGARALLVHALNDSLVSYYQSLGFIRFNPASKTLYIPTKTIRDGL